MSHLTTVHGVTLHDGTDFAALAAAALKGGAGLPAEHPYEPAHQAILRLYSALDGTPHAARLARAVAAHLSDEDELVQEEAAFFFHACPAAPGAEEVESVALRLARPGQRRRKRPAPLPYCLLHALGARASVGSRQAIDLAREAALVGEQGKTLLGGLLAGDPDWVIANIEEILRRAPDAFDELFMARPLAEENRNAAQQIRGLIGLPPAVELDAVYRGLRDLPASWPFPTRIFVRHEVLELLDLSAFHSAGDEGSDFQGMCGTWWVLRLASSLWRNVLGLRMRPGVPVERWPLVSQDYDGPVAVTLGSSGACTLPMAMLVNSLLGKTKWEHLERSTELAWAQLNTLHELCGGTDGLAALRALASDADLRAELESQEPMRRAEAVLQAAVILDPDPQTRIYVQAAREALQERRAPWPLPEGVGCWGGALAGMAFELAREADDRTTALEAAWDLSRRPAGLDSSLGIALPWMQAADQDRARDRLRAAACLLVEHQDDLPGDWISDPLWEALQSLGRSGRPKGYNGRAHLTAARKLLELGDAERAFDTILSGAFWAMRRHEPLPPEFLGQARALAESCGDGLAAEVLASHHK